MDASVLDAGTISTIVDGAKSVLGIMTTPPLGVFITIGVVGSIVGLVAGIVRTVKNR